MGVWGWREAGGDSAFRGRTHPPPCTYAGTCALCPSRRVPSPFVPWCSLWILPLSTYPCRKEEAFFASGNLFRHRLFAPSFAGIILWHLVKIAGRSHFVPHHPETARTEGQIIFFVQTPFGFCLNVKNNVSIFISIRCYFSK